jgi:hypothetical protein
MAQRLGARAVTWRDDSFVESWSVSDPLAVCVVSGWWGELGVVVCGVDPDLPGGVVEDPVVVAAHEHQVGQLGGASVGPVS